MKSTTKSTTREQRIRAAQKHLQSLTPVPDLLRAFVQQWGVSISTARRDLREARKRLEQEATIVRETITTDHLTIVRQQLRSLAGSVDHRDRKLLLDFLRYEAHLHGILTPTEDRHRQEIAATVQTFTRKPEP